MSNVITGGIAVLMALVYMLHYAYRLNSIALWLIIAANIAALIFDYYNSIREGEDNI
jgi:hypothetical protein